MGDAFEGLVLVCQRDCRTGAQSVRFSVPTKASDGFSRFSEEAFPQIRLRVAERGASVDVAEMLEGPSDVHMAATALLG
eukprot:8692626-Lingulodinium_polyedra.AAC.1